MTESTNPTPLQSQAEKIRADLSAMLLKAAQSASPSAAQATPSAAAANPVNAQKPTSAGQ
ncbi:MULTISPECIES: hypothetical protein [Giesbergeria]|uniref:Uncharacterized protein n=1 Tax=Giesbergeria sinuosa TaxID=80883 RepID=A0ABV9QFC0_9BURK